MSLFHTIKAGRCTMAPELNVTPCCLAHDEAYLKGGSAADRKAADIALRTCMRSKGQKVACWIYYFAVRIFGWVGWNWTKEEMGYE